MSFICGICKLPSAPRVKPLTAAVSRHRDYYELDEKDNLVQVGTGREIEKEVKVCQTCAGNKPIDLSELKELNEGKLARHRAMNNGWGKKHVKSCDGTVKVKRNGVVKVIPCHSCEEITAIYAEIPAPMLSKVLEDEMAPQVKVTFGSLVAHSGLDQAHFTDRRTGRNRKSLRNFKATAGLIQPYLDSNSVANRKVLQG